MIVHIDVSQEGTSYKASVSGLEFAFAFHPEIETAVNNVKKTVLHWYAEQMEPKTSANSISFVVDIRDHSQPATLAVSKKEDDA